MLWHAYLTPTDCLPNCTDQQLPPLLSLKCWKMMLSVVIASALLITCVLGQIKGVRSWKQQKYHRLWKVKRLSICCQDGQWGFCLYAEGNIFPVIWSLFLQTSSHLLSMVSVALMAAPAVEPAVRSKLWAQFRCLSQPCCTVVPHWVFLEAENSLKVNIKSWNPPRDLDKLQSQ